MTETYNTFADAMKKNNNDMTKFELDGNKYIKREDKNEEF